MTALLLAVLLAQGISQDSLDVRAESALAAGDPQTALKLAQKLAERRPDDPQAHFLLGRVQYSRPIVGRWAALEEFKKAARLAPQDPAPVYWQMKVGFYLRSDDGDRIARDALLKLFAITPDYQDAWTRFHDVYQGPAIWKQAERALARHGDDPTALEHRAELLIDLADGQRADSLLAIAMARRAPTVKTFLLRSEASFLAADALAGYAWHDSALAHANEDASEALWEEAWSIASPEEAQHYVALGPGEMREFFERFWGERDPNLLTPANERLVEHYARRAEARRMYRLLQPQRSSYHSEGARALHAYEMRREGESIAFEVPGATGASSEQLAAQARTAMLAWPATSLGDTALAIAAHSGLTAQGLVFLRHGRPDRQTSCITDLLRPYPVGRRCNSFLKQETWLYLTPAGPLSLSFWENEYFFPISEMQLQSTRIALHTDRSTLPAPLEARAWSALFRSSELGLTDVYYRTNGDSAAAVLWDTAGQIQPIRASGPGLLLLSVPPGLYHLGVDVDSAGNLGRWRSEVRIPHFSPVDLGLSSLVLAPSAVLLDREAALRGMPVDLAYPAGTPLASYVEIYGLTPDRSGRAHYHLRYSFAPVQSLVGKLLSNARSVVFEFDRETESSTAFERLIIEPDRLPAGRYRLTLSVTDLVRNVKSEAATLDIVIR
ncbi:MAG TPA: GWxTD domain-containing protein [Gemmatimonadales bacterium]|nr:GWxTD domain-containing protein [Gemmatimonadales bacterium]